MLKQGLDALRMEDYQVLYCEEGLASGEELERLKIMSSTEHFVCLLPDILHAHVAVNCILQAKIQCLSMAAVCFAAWLLPLHQSCGRTKSVSVRTGAVQHACAGHAACRKLSMDVHHCFLFVGGRWKGRFGQGFLVNVDLPSVHAGALRMDSKAPCAA